ncbi:hypothetical protein H4R35_004421 [Dimargaris xerosporica]|nr:hypothetical protein H4R35_004421 [Dimargaris xerosporica]
MNGYFAITVLALAVTAAQIADSAPTPFVGAPTGSTLPHSQLQHLSQTPSHHVSENYANGSFEGTSNDFEQDGSSDDMDSNQDLDSDSDSEMPNQMVEAESSFSRPVGFSATDYSQVLAKWFQEHHNPSAFVEHLINGYNAQGSPGDYPIGMYLRFFQYWLQTLPQAARYYDDLTMASVAIGPLLAYLRALESSCSESDEDARTFLQQTKQIIGIPSIRSVTSAHKVLEQELSQRSDMPDASKALWEIIEALGFSRIDTLNNVVEKYASRMSHGSLSWDDAADFIIDLFEIVAIDFKNYVDHQLMQA